MEGQGIDEYEMRLMVVVSKKDAIAGGEFATVKRQDGRPSNGNLMIAVSY
jgi:hypothetical protein